MIISNIQKEKKLTIGRFKLPIIKIKGDCVAKHEKREKEDWEMVWPLGLLEDGNLEINDYAIGRLDEAAEKDKFKKFRMVTCSGFEGKPYYEIEGKRDELLFLKKAVSYFKSREVFAEKYDSERYEKYKKRLDKLENKTTLKNITIGAFILPIIQVEGNVDMAYEKQQKEEWEIICALGNFEGEIEIPDYIVTKLQDASNDRSFEKFRMTAFLDHKNKQAYWIEGKREELLFLKHNVAVYKGLKNYPEVYDKYKLRLDKLEKRPVQMTLFEGFD